MLLLPLIIYLLQFFTLGFGKGSSHSNSRPKESHLRTESQTDAVIDRRNDNHRPYYHQNSHPPKLASSAPLVIVNSTSDSELPVLATSRRRPLSTSFVLGQRDALNESVSLTYLPTPPPLPAPLLQENEQALLQEFLQYDPGESELLEHFTSLSGRSTKAPPEDPFSADDYGQSEVNYSAVVPKLISTLTKPLIDKYKRIIEPAGGSIQRSAFDPDPHPDPPNLIPLSVKIVSLEEKLYSSEKSFKPKSKADNTLANVSGEGEEEEEDRIDSSEATDVVLKTVFGTTADRQIKKFKRLKLNQSKAKQTHFRSPFTPVTRRSPGIFHPKFCCYLAKNGHCLQRKEWMLLNCAKACFDSSCVDCVDSAEYCPFWSGHGECDSNPSYMLITCRRSCKLCKSKADKDKAAKSPLDTRTRLISPAVWNRRNNS